MGPAGKVAIVTGAGSGIGRAAALALLEEAGRSSGHGRRSEAVDRGPHGHRALVVPTDVTDPGSVRSLFEATAGPSAASTSSSTTPGRGPAGPARRPDD